MCLLNALSPVNNGHSFPRWFLFSEEEMNRVLGKPPPKKRKKPTFDDLFNNLPTKEELEKFAK